MLYALCSLRYALMNRWFIQIPTNMESVGACGSEGVSEEVAQGDEQPFEKTLYDGAAHPYIKLKRLRVS